MRDADACTRGLAASDDRVHAGLDRPPGWRTVDRYVVIPSLRRPGLLVPPGSRRPAAAAARQYLLIPGRAGRTATAAAAAALRTGLAQRIGRSRLSISVAPEVADADLPDLVLRHHLAAVLGERDVELAVRVGATRPNGKPVVQVARPGGAVVAYAKVGWNELTRPLVAAEAAALRTLVASGDGPRTFRVARLIEAEEWRGHTLTLVAPVVGGAPVSALEPPRDATHELALGGGVSRSALVDSAWWQDVLARIDAAGADLADAAEAIAASAGDAPLAFGRLHGDWTPWNMRRVDGRLVVWDWERSRSDAPIGIDAVHYGLLVALNVQKLSPPAAVTATLAGADRWLPDLDQPASGRLILCLELLEMSLRYAEARAAGVTLRHDRFGAALRDLLDLRPARSPVPSDGNV